MAIAFDQNLGTGTANATAASLTTAAAAAANSKIYLISSHQAGGTVTPSGGSLTWTKDFDFLDGDGRRLVISSADAASGLAISTTLTSTSTVSGQCAVCAMSFTGLAAQGSVVDQVASGRLQFNTTGWSSNSITTVNANDLLLGVCVTVGVDPSTGDTPGTGYTEVHDFKWQGALAGFTTLYQIVAATGTYTASGTWAAAVGADQESGLVAYKAGAAAPSFSPKILSYYTA